MKNLFLVLSFLVLGLVSCSSCAKKSEVVGPTCDGSGCPLPSTSATVPVPADRVVTGPDWEFKIPVSWEQHAPDPESHNVEVVFFNPEKKNLVLLIKEVWLDTYDAYMIDNLRSLKDAGATVKSMTQVTINGTKFTLFEAERNGLNMWVWATYRSGTGYALTCGGAMSESWHKDLCQNVANSFKLKQ